MVRRLIQGLKHFSRNLMHRREVESELDEEMETFLEMRTREKVRAGLAPEKAARAARVELGGTEAVKEKVRSVRRGMALETLVRDCRFAVRMLFRNPGLTGLAAVALALGIGANTAIFSLAEASLFRTPEVRNPDEIVAVWTTCRRGDPRCSSSYPDYLDYRDRSTTLADLAATHVLTASLGGEGSAELVPTQLVTGNFFNLLGLRPAVGRLLLPEDDLAGRPETVVVLSHDYWMRQFAGRRGIVGETIDLNRTRFTVVGVAPERFEGINLGAGPGLYIPMFAGPVLGTGYVEDDSRFALRGSRWISQLVGRLAPGATLAQARSEMALLSDQLTAEYPEERGPRTITIDPAATLVLPVDNEADLVRFIALLQGVVGLTLLLACANLANLLLARASARSHEFGVRLAIGAGRGRILRQLITESLCLAVLGGAAGLIVAVLLLSLLGGYMLPGNISIEALDASLNPRVLVLTFLLSLLTGVLFGLAPALQAGRQTLVSVLNRSGRGSRQGPSGRLRGLLIAAQVALCVILLVGSGLFLQTLSKGFSHNLGFPTRGLALARLNLAHLHYSPTQARAFLEEVEHRLANDPMVEGVGFSTRVPLLPDGTATFIERIPGYQPAADEELRLEYARVRPGFLEALGVPLLEGRLPRPTDESARVAVVNAEMANRWWGERSPVGKQIYLGEQAIDIIGVVANTPWDDGMLTAPYPFAFFPTNAETEASSPMALVVRGTDADELLPRIRQVIASVDPGVALSLLGTMEEQQAGVLLPQRMGSLLLNAFAGLAVVLALIGIYGIVSYTVTQRSHEIGVRIALGAETGQVRRLVAGGILLPLVAGLAIGLWGAVLLGQRVESLLFGVEPNDIRVLIAAPLLLSAMALLAAFLPSRRAARISPLVTLNPN